MRIETTIRRRSGRLCFTLTAMKARIIAQAWGVTPEQLVGRAVVLDLKMDEPGV